MTQFQWYSKYNKSDVQLRQEQIDMDRRSKLSVKEKGENKWNKKTEMKETQ